MPFKASYFKAYLPVIIMDPGLEHIKYRAIWSTVNSFLHNATTGIIC